MQRFSRHRDVPATGLNAWEHARSLGLAIDRRAEIGGAGDGDARNAGVSEPVRVAIGDVDVGADRLFVIDLADQLAAASGRYYDGILGRTLFDRYVVRIDFEHRIIELFAPASYRPPVDGHVVPIWIENGHPHFRARVTLASGDIVELDLVIDSGARTALILDAPGPSDVSAPPDAVEMIIGHGARGPVRGRMGRVTALALGDTAVRDVLTAFVDDAVGATPGADGNLGTELLRRFTVTFDYAGRRMLLEPKPALGDPYPVDLSGVTLRAGGPRWSELSIGAVRPGSPASTANVQVRDVIMAVDGLPPPLLEELEQRFQQPGPVVLELLRGDSTLTASLVLRPASF